MEYETKQQNIYSALKSREEIPLKRKTRVLFTKIKTIDDFDLPYKDSNLSLETVIRKNLHTTIVVSQERNVLESMDGSLFSLSQEADAQKLTDEVVELIGGMFYGISEVENLREEMQSK